jgi:hypothetical protein
LARAAGESMRSIADRLGRSASTISRELRRNLDRQGRYRSRRRTRWPTTVPAARSRTPAPGRCISTSPNSSSLTTSFHTHLSYRPGGRRSLLPNPRTRALYQHQSQLLITNHLLPHTPQLPTRRPPLITAEPPHPGAVSAPVPTPHHQPPPSTHTSATDQAATWGARSVTLLARSLTATGEPICGSLRTPVCAPRTISILCDPVPFAAASSQGGTCTVQ